MIPSGKCLVCDAPAAVVGSGVVEQVDCVRCGVFTIGKPAVAVLQNFTSEKRALLSAYIFENEGIQLTEPILKELENTLRLPPVNIRAEKLFLYIAKRNPRIGWGVGISSDALMPEMNVIELFKQECGQTADIYEPLRYHFSLIAVTSSHDFMEVRYLLENILVGEMGVITFDEIRRFYQISPKGWSYLASVQKNPLSAAGFVAMSFDSSLRPLYELGLSPGISSAAYHPLVMHEHEHANRIDDEIIASIRRSRFCVTDLTLRNNGAYFEAGYALGFGIPVFWTCRAGEQIHFDARQFNILYWEDGQFDDLAKRLRFRIERVVGRGPLPD